MSFLTPSIMGGSDWRALERAVCRVMSHCGWKEANVVGRAGDKGGDVVAVREENGQLKKWVVQVKAVTGNNYVGPAAFKEVTEAMSYYGAQRAAVATNGTFTDSAIKYRGQVESVGFSVKAWNGHFLEDLLSRWPESSSQMKELRVYQDGVVGKVLEKFANGGTKAQFVIATGLGKTVIAASITRLLAKKDFRRVLVLCHATDLALQLEQAFWNQISKDVPTRIFMDGSPPSTYEGITFGLYQTLIGYLGGLNPNAFDLIVVDEAHHAVGNQFQDCIDHFSPKFLLGMTATPWRGDGGDIDAVFEKPVERLSLVDGMRLGALAEVDYRIMCDNIDWPELPRLAGKNVSVSQLNRTIFLPQRDEAAILEIRKAVSNYKTPRIAIFSPSIDHAERFARHLSACGIPAKSLSIDDKVERRKRLLDFSSGSLVAVTAVDVLNEGIDIPEVNILVFMRATHSRRIFVQQLGRGLRLAPGKTKVLVLDFVTDIRRIAEICSMDRELTSPKKGSNIVLKDTMVSFSDERAGNFVDVWLKDVSSLADSSDSEKLKFPEMNL